MLATRSGGDFEITLFSNTNLFSITWLSIPSTQRGFDQHRLDIKVFFLNWEILQVEWTTAARRPRPRPRAVRFQYHQRGEDEEIPAEEEF